MLAENERVSGYCGLCIYTVDDHTNHCSDESLPEGVSAPVINNGTCITYDCGCELEE